MMATSCSSLLLIVFTILASLWTVQGSGCSPTPCGTNAMCQESGIAGSPVCSCLAGYTGESLTYCHPYECILTTECRGDMACVNARCVNPCTLGVCGVNSICKVIRHNPICSCPAGHSGDPFTFCRPNECLDNTECRGDMACRAGSCANPCLGTCGVNSNCQVIKHVAACICPAGYTGNPFSYCRPAFPVRGDLGLKSP